MDLHPAAILAGGATCFAAVVALGAFAIASLTPSAAPPVIPAGASLFTNEAPRLGPVIPAEPKPVVVSLPTMPAPPAAAPPPPAPAESFAATPPPAREVPRRTRPKPADELAARTLPTGLREEPLAPVRVPRPEQAARIAPAAPEQPMRSIAPPVRAPFAGIEPPAARPPVMARTEGVFTPAEIGRMRSALRLTPEQRGFWPPVEDVLREIGAQQAALVASGRRPNEAYEGGVSMRLYWAASPLLGVLRPDQKEEIRRRARAMGFDQVASAI